jgi:RNA polymerase sigma factor (sigma-70 family)
MIEWTDHELLAEFARNGSEEAFTALTARYVNLVYSAALRFTNNPHQAEEISQAVFIVLARKAGGLRQSVVLSGWLYQTARLTAANFMKGEIRRQRREQEAYMQSSLNESDGAAWEQIAPLLDDAMGDLAETDRTAVVLRFFENKTAAEVAATLKLTEAAAHKRLGRALEKLRKLFAKRGVALSVPLIMGAVAANSVQAAPAHVAQIISTAALAKGATAGGSTLALAKGVLKIMAWTKAKAAVVVSAVVLLTGGTATVATMAIFSRTPSHTGILAPGQMDKLTVNEIVTQSKDAYAALTSYSDEGSSSATIGTTKVSPHEFSIKLTRPNLYRIEWKKDMGGSPSTGIVWSEGKGNFLRMFDGVKPSKYSNMEMALSGATGISGGAAGSIPGTFFKLNWGDKLGSLIQSAARKPDELIEGVPCYVFTQKTANGTETIWIGRQDFLIRQIENDTDAKILKALLSQQTKQHPELKSMMSAAPSGDVRSIETHRNISVNPTLTQTDFVP